MNSIHLMKRRRVPQYKKVVLRYPSRLNAMAIDPSKIRINRLGIYTPGEILFPIQIFKKVGIEIRTDHRILIHTKSLRTHLILHAARLMQKALKVRRGFNITVEMEREMRHCGLGSSSGLMAAVAASINELYGNPISAHDLIKYLAQNHGEEIDGDEKNLQRVQCIGGSAAAGLVHGGMITLAGVGVPVATMRIAKDRKVVIGIPRDFIAPDAKTLMRKERQHMSAFVKTGKKYGATIAYHILHTTLPAMREGNLKVASRIIFTYRFKYGSIKNCSFVYPRMNQIAQSIQGLFTREDVDTLSLSSVGPAFFAITTNQTQCRTAFEKAGMRVFVTKINNDGYKVLYRRK